MNFLSLFCGIVAIIFSFGCFADPNYSFWVFVIGCVGFVAGITDYLTARRNPKNNLISTMGIAFNLGALLIWLVFSVFFEIEENVEHDNISPASGVIVIEGE